MSPRHARPSRLRGWTRVQWHPSEMTTFLAWILALASCCAVLAWFDYDVRRTVLHEGAVTDAVVVRFHNCSPCGRFDDSYYVVDLLLPDGPVRVDVSDYEWRVPAPGSIVRVRYVPRDPYYDVRDAASPLPTYGKAIWGAIGLALLAASAWTAKHTARGRRLLATLARF